MVSKHVLFCLSKYFDKLYGIIAYKMQIEINNLIQLLASLVLAVSSEFSFSLICRLTMYKLITSSTLI